MTVLYGASRHHHLGKQLCGLESPDAEQVRERLSVGRRDVEQALRDGDRHALGRSTQRHVRGAHEVRRTISAGVERLEERQVREQVVVVVEQVVRRDLGEQLAQSPLLRRRRLPQQQVGEPLATATASAITVLPLSTPHTELPK